MRALLSVFDKSGIAEFASALNDLGVGLVSSGGTAAKISEAGIDVTDVADFTGFPAILGHRVVTLHPAVHGGILADTSDASHQEDLDEYGIEPIDIVVGNLYPFGESPGVEMIDIGGPTLVRAAAKNHDRVTVLVDPADYPTVLAEIADNGSTSLETRRSLARKAFAHTAAYDAAIVGWMDSELFDHPDSLPPTIHLPLERAQDLRYGENPHQEGARYRKAGSPTWWDSVDQHSGLALSYLNLFDANAAWQLANSLSDEPTVAIIKHANPCGLAVGASLAKAYSDAFACDPRSAFGGIVALNGIVDQETVEAIELAAQADVIIAPGYADGVIDRLIAKRKNTRLLTAPTPESPELTIRQLSSGYLVQQDHYFGSDPANWQVVTKRQPTEAQLVDARLAWKVGSYVTSNSIVLLKDGVAWGIGAGQQNRVESGEIAASKANGRAVGGACASDAFYPFPDGIEAAADAGAAVVVQPGGSVNDDEVIKRADELGLIMLFTGERQFRH